MTRAALGLALALAPSLAAAQSSRDVPYFLRNPAERRAVQQWCAADAGRQDTAECRNAKAAGAAEIVTPGHKWSRGPAAARPARRPAPVLPAGKGPPRAA